MAARLYILISLHVVLLFCDGALEKSNHDSNCRVESITDRRKLMRLSTGWS